MNTAIPGNFKENYSIKEKKLAQRKSGEPQRTIEVFTL